MRYLIVEGITDVSLVKYICVQKKITDKFNEFELQKSRIKVDEKREVEIELYVNSIKNLTIINATGQNNLEIILREIIRPMEIKVDRVGIIQDADNDFSLSLDTIKNAIDNSGIDEHKINREQDIFLMPDNKNIGDLETLLLSTIEGTTIVNCFDSYKQCLQSDQEIHPKALNKGQVYAYTMYSQSGKNLYKPQDSFMHKKNKKYQDTGLWDINKDEFKPIVDFVVNTFKK